MGQQLEQKIRTFILQNPSIIRRKRLDLTNLRVKCSLSDSNVGLKGLVNVVSPEAMELTPTIPFDQLIRIVQDFKCIWSTFQRIEDFNKKGSSFKICPLVRVATRLLNTFFNQHPQIVSLDKLCSILFNRNLFLSSEKVDALLMSALLNSD